jgi:hypothetical protein
MELQRLTQPVTNAAQGVVDLAHPHAARLLVVSKGKNKK